MTARGAVLLAALAVGLGFAPPGEAAETAPSRPSDPNALQVPARDDEPPKGFAMTANEAAALAEREPAVRETRRRHRPLERREFTKGTDRWQVSYYNRPGRGDEKEVAQVLIVDSERRVKEAWTGHQVAWTMARGYPGAFGRKAGALYVWIPLCLLFLAPFFDPRRPLRMLHLDLLMLVGFSVSLAFFSHGVIGWSVPVAYPFLLYALGRMLWLARRRALDLRRPDGARPREPLRLLVPAAWLAVALVFLVGFRVGLNVVNSNVIDVGYSGVIGADRLADGEPLYDRFPADNRRGDTYGPVAYYAYVPFEQLFPWSGSWDDLPAAHAAAIAFDLLTMLGLWLLGRRIRGPTLGLVLAYAWAAFPFTLYVSSSNANDGLVALLVVLALLVAARSWARGVAGAWAALTKFAPLGIVPLLATYDHARATATLRPRVLVPFGLAFAGAAALALAPFLGDLGTVFDRTLGFQSDRGSPFSVWGLWPGMGTAQAAVKIAAAALCVVIAFVPRRRDVISLAALAAAAIIALQLGVTHWFYLYLVWFLPAVLVALLAPYGEPARRSAPSPPAAPRAREPVAA